MTERRRVLGIVLAAAIAGTCGGPERRVVSNYFGTLAQGDNQTLASFATVRLEEQVDSWEVSATSEEQLLPVTLPDLIKARNERKAELDVNKEAANDYYDEHLDAVDEIRELLKEEEPKIPRRLETIAEEWKVFTDKDLELKRALADANDAVSRETGVTKLSDGTATDLETRGGQIRSLDVDLVLTIGGQPKNYTMTLRRYDLEGGSGRSRWVVAALDPK